MPNYLLDAGSKDPTALITRLPGDRGHMARTGRRIYRRMNMQRKIAVIIFASLMAACSVGPKYTRPVVPAPPSYKELGEAEGRATQRRRGSRQMVGTISGSAIEQPGRPAQPFQSENSRRGSEPASRASHDPRGQVSVLPHAHGQAQHRQFAHLDGVRTTGRNDFHHLLHAARGFLGAGPVWPRPEHRESQFVRRAGQRGGLLPASRPGRSQTSSRFYGERVSGGSQPDAESVPSGPRFR